MPNKVSKFDVRAFEKLIIYEDQHILVVNKPTGMLSQGDSTNDASMFSLSKQYLAHQRGKEDPATVYLGLVHRLDRVSSGVLLLAKRTKAAARLSENIRSRQDIQKHYMCVVHGAVPAAAREGGEPGSAVFLEDWLIAPPGSSVKNKTRVLTASSKLAKAASGEHAVLAQLQYHSCGPVDKHPADRPQSLLHVVPTTGRKHQIRAQLSHVNLPVVWDGKYGATARSDKERGIALHAVCMVIPHPAPPGRTMVFSAPLPESWTKAFGERVHNAAEQLVQKLKKQHQQPRS